MKYVVDARFEKGKPHLRVLDANTGVVRMEWTLTRVTQMLENGEIPKDDFLHPERYGMQLLVKNLFLLSCLESFSVNSAPCSIEKNREVSMKRHHTNSPAWHFSIKAKPV